MCLTHGTLGGGGIYEAGLMGGLPVAGDVPLTGRGRVRLQPLPSPLLPGHENNGFALS